MIRSRRAWLNLLLIPGFACGGEDPPAGPTTGTISVSVATTGEEIPADYSAVLDGANGRPVTVNGVVLFTGVSAGEHTVTLSEVPANCSVTSPNPAAVMVIGGETAQVAMAVACVATEGAIRIEARTTGEALDPDGYLVSVDGGVAEVLDANGFVIFTGLAAGDREVTLSGIAPNCTLTDAPSRTVSVVAGGTATVVFELVCAANSWIAFGAGDLYLIRPDGANLTLLTPPEDDVGGLAPVWSPDGSRLAYRSNDGGSPSLFVMGRDGTDVVQVLAYEVDFCCDYAWSPDGSRLAVSDGMGGGASIYVVDATGANLAKLTDSPVADAQPAWSPDGSRIAFRRSAGEAGDLYRIGSDGTDEIQLTTNPAEDAEPAWSPDGTRIAFRRGYEEGGVSHSAIYTMSPDGSNLLDVSGGPGNDGQPVWSPDGTRIAFVGERNGNVDIYVVNADGTGLTRVTTAPEVDEGPTWSPDGSRLAFCRRIGPDQLFTVNADGSGEAQLLPEGCTPDWSPYLP